MKRAILCILLFVAVSVLLFACETGSSTKKEDETIIPKETTRVQSEPAFIEVSGTIRALDQAQLAPRVPSTVRSVLVVAGQKVKKGELLILMDDRNLIAQEDKLKAGHEELDHALEEAQQAMDAAEAQKQLASNTFERIRSLYQKEASSKQEFEEAESRWKAAEASFRAAQARVGEVQAKQAQLKSDQSDLLASSGYVRIVAPFDGVVTEVPAKAGTFFNPGQSVVSVENPDRFQLVFAVGENLLSSLRKDQVITVRVSSLSSGVLNASVAEISPSMDAYTATFQVKVNLAPGVPVRGGLSGTALIPSAAKTLWIPEQYVTSNQDVETVLVRAGEIWRRVLVKTGTRKDGKVEILSGLNPNDEIGD